MAHGGAAFASRRDGGGSVIGFTVGGVPGGGMRAGDDGRNVGRG